MYRIRRDSEGRQLPLLVALQVTAHRVDVAGLVDAGPRDSRIQENFSTVPLFHNTDFSASSVDPGDGEF